MQKITPCLWFDSQAEEAVNYYITLFNHAKITRITHYDKASAEVSGQPEGSVLTVAFELDGNEFVAMNGGPIFKFTEAISLMVNCRDQEEVDRMWTGLSAGGEEGQCGWLKDRYGLSWQVAPSILEELLNVPDPEKAGRVMQAFMQMKKIDIAELLRAAAD